MGYTLYIRNHVRKVWTKAKKRRRLTIISHVNTNESKKLKSPNIDYVKIRTISSFSNLEDGISSNTLINFPKRIDPESIFCINNKIPVPDGINKDNYTHKISLDIIIRRFYDSDTN